MHKYKILLIREALRARDKRVTIAVERLNFSPCLIITRYLRKLTDENNQKEAYFVVETVWEAIPPTCMSICKSRPGLWLLSAKIFWPILRLNLNPYLYAYENNFDVARNDNLT